MCFFKFFHSILVDLIAVRTNLCGKLTAGNFLCVVAGCKSDHDDPEEPGSQGSQSGPGYAVRAVGRTLCGGV